jgi:hypothetical protein
MDIFYNILRESLVLIPVKPRAGFDGYHAPHDPRRNGFQHAQPPTTGTAGFISPDCSKYWIVSGLMFPLIAPPFSDFALSRTVTFPTVNPPPHVLLMDSKPFKARKSI